jgi:hypothetical protein
LADAATVAVEPGLLDRIVRTHLQLDADHVSAERIVVLVPVSRTLASSTVKRILVVVQNVFLIDVFFVIGHDHPVGFNNVLAAYQSSLERRRRTG